MSEKCTCFGMGSLMKYCPEHGEEWRKLLKSCPEGWRPNPEWVMLGTEHDVHFEFNEGMLGPER